MCFAIPVKAFSPLTPGILSVAEKISVVFYDAPVMLEVAKAESRLNPLARNAKSSAKGLFQILDGTWEAYGCKGDVLNEDDNIACARRIYDESGLSPWNASKASWYKSETPRVVAKGL